MYRRKMPAKIWVRGKKIVQNDKVHIEKIDKTNKVVKATVFGTYPYAVEVNQADPDADSCECPYFPGNGYCKHIAAVIEYFKAQNTPIEALFDNDESNALDDGKTTMSTHSHSKPVTNFPEIRMVHRKKPQADEYGELFLKNLDIPEKQYFQPLPEAAAEPLSLEVTLMVGQVNEGLDYDTLENRFFIKFRVAAQSDQRFYIVNNLDRFFEAYKNNDVFQTAGKADFQLGKSAFSETDQKLLDFIVEAGKPDFTGNSTLSPSKYLLLSTSHVSQFFKLFEELPDFKFQQAEHKTVFNEIIYKQFQPDDGLLEGTLAQDDGYKLTITSHVQTYVAANAVLIVQNKLYQATPRQMDTVKQILSAYNTIMGNEITRKLRQEADVADPAAMHFAWGSETELNDFIEFFKEVGVITVPKVFMTNQMTPHFDLSKNGNELQLELNYEYDGELISSANIGKYSKASRNLDKEKQTKDYLASLKFKPQNDVWVKNFDQEDVLYRFFMQELPNLRANGIVAVSEDLQALLHDSNDLKPAVDVSEKDGLLTVKFSVDGVSENDVDHMLEQLDVEQPYISQSDGSIILVDDEFRKVSKALLKIRKQGKFKHGEMQVHASQALAVQAALKDTANFDEKFQALSTNLAHPEKFEVKTINPVNGTLRPYQEVGVRWLEMLDSYNFGGILADEMGLGKTIQMIAFLMNHLDESKPDLIVSPASLIYNWQEEFAKFAPNVTTQVVDGNKENRRELIEKGKTEVLITSYNSARLDVAEYNERKINYLVLDEAQYVKNASTKTNQSIRKLTPKNTFALSGTPIENRVEELWAIFEIIMPGLLPGKKAFKKLSPEEVAVRVKPFILRREKSVVLKDIPAKVETNLYNELTTKQKTVYLAQLKQMQVKVQGMTSTSFVKNKLAILAGLTRLRQICDTPSLYMDEYRGDSGKLEQLYEILRQAEENDRHVLIFSQFTSMLDIIGNELTKQKMDHYVLQGSTKPKERLDMVNEFNAGEKNIFLISLKAGGTGLNLTGADMVILVDLWWNPAVEDQATARAHRIGQTKKVDVFRLITKGTIEEQIYKLQEKKRNFVDQVLSGTENKGSLTEEEVRLILGIE
ncbi:SNF2-related protein [Pediococcus damnosus]|uniref:SNF2-related protein n=1 Tax=Pediococcus damnosus TaxID=51663 RepID=UPI000C1CAA39|nr:SNF2-related protein [Pediococcus damnosus]PIO84974.1 helicase SNF2 [Pediococcus damnosus]